jgi:hypothetical protein
MPTSTLLQLVARGRQDGYLTGSPQFTFFKQVYRRHTPFAIESIPIEFDGNPDFGRRISAVIPRKADLLSSLFLEVDLPPLTTAADIAAGNPRYWWCNDIGHALIEDVSIEIGEKEVDKHTGEWLNIWGELTTPADKRDGYNEMVGHWTVWPPADDVSLRSQRLTIPLRFWFCNTIGAALPLIALQAHTVRLIIHLRRFCDLWWCDGMDSSVTCPQPAIPSISRCQLFGDYMFLETEERQKFATTEHEYLIEQLQYSPMHAVAPGRSITNIPLHFNHCCKEFIWVVQEDRMRGANHQWFNFSNELFEGEAGVVQTDLLDSAVLRLEGLDRFYSRTAQYFRMIQPYQRHTVVPNNYIYLYSFSLNPEDVQPSGTLNASKIDDINLHLRFAADQVADERFVTVYATNYNILRIVGGLGGVAFIA